MIDRSVSWVGSISDDLDTRGPTCFTRQILKKQKDLFAHRCALFYTPTENIPAENVGSGNLDITLPLVTPDYTSLREIKTYASPRFWVDLLQQQSGKLRWTPLARAQIEFVRYDCYYIRHDHVVIGLKALEDALKVRTTGRRDRKYVHYFGAIVDDSPGLVDVTFRQMLVEHPKDARVRVHVSPSAHQKRGSSTV